MIEFCQNIQYFATSITSPPMGHPLGSLCWNKFSKGADANELQQNSQLKTNTVFRLLRTKGASWTSPSGTTRLPASLAIVPEILSRTRSNFPRCHPDFLHSLWWVKK